MKRLTVIACSSLRPELELLAGEAGTAITFQHLEMGLHQRSAEALHAALQDAIDAAAADRCDAVAVGYGLCNRGVVGLRARAVPVVVPRAHDCIGLLLGSNRRYLDQLAAQPGTYFQSAGWLAQADSIRQPDFTFGPNSNVTRERLVARYGEDNADYLLGRFEDFTQHYERLAYIATPAPASALQEAAAQTIAGNRHWQYERLAGDLGWLRRLLSGDWKAREFVILAPGERLALTFDAHLMAAEPL